jgi:hypothetical protein
LVYLISGGFVLFFRPKYFIWFIPLIAQKMFNDSPARWSIESYYSVQIITILPLSVFLILGNLKSTKIKYSLAILLPILALGVTRYENNPAHHKMLYNPVKGDVFDKTFFNPPYNAKSIQHALELIPADAPVSASASILPHLSQRDHIYEFPDVQDAEYIAAFTFPDFYAVPAEKYENDLYSKYVFNPDWQVIANERPFILLKKSPGRKKFLQYDSIVCSAETMSSDYKHLVASDNELINNDSSTLSSERAHTGKYSVKLTKEKAYGMSIHPMNVVSGDMLCISIWRFSEKEGDGVLLASTGKGFYVPSSGSVAKDSTGWEQLVIYCSVPEDYKDFTVYIWDNGEKPVWFDDMEIKKVTIKTEAGNKP